MSEQPTPETDKIAKSLLYENADKRDYEFRQHARRLERERDAERALADRLAEAAKAVIDQWEIPNWRLRESTAKYMNTLRNNLAAWKEARSE